MKRILITFAVCCILSGCTYKTIIERNETKPHIEEVSNIKWDTTYRLLQDANSYYGGKKIGGKTMRLISFNGYDNNAYHRFPRGTQLELDSYVLISAITSSLFAPVLRITSGEHAGELVYPYIHGGGPVFVDINEVLNDPSRQGLWPLQVIDSSFVAEASPD
jgi:uncharacterized protein YceK